MFLQHGFALWNNYWYAGRYSYVTYSLIYYPLAALVGIKLLAVASAALAAAAFALIVEREWPAAGPWPARTFTLVAAAAVLTGAYPYALGLALGLLALAALGAGRSVTAAVLVVLTFAASPLAFALLAVVLAAVAAAKRRPAVGPTVAVAATAGCALALWRAFPGEGRYPFSLAELCASLAFCALGVAFTWKVPAARALSYVFWAYGIACALSFAVPSQVGENIARLRFIAVPLAVLALSLRGWRPLVPAAAALALAVSWNVTPLAFSFARASTDPSAKAEYWQPVLSFLGRVRGPSYRVEVVDTAGHWAAVYLARAGVPLARGWFRQDDFPQNDVLYKRLGRQAYLHWLRLLGVKYVVLTDAPLDYSARREAKLLRSGRSGLVLRFVSPHARIYELPGASGIVTGARGAGVVSLRPDAVVLHVRRAARYRVALRYSPYWTSTAACVKQAANGMIDLVVTRPGRITLTFEVTPGRAIRTIAGAPVGCGQRSRPRVPQAAPQGQGAVNGPRLRVAVVNLHP
jgi:hypothetical protein